MKVYFSRSAFGFLVVLGLCFYILSCMVVPIASTAFLANKALIETNTGGSAQIVFVEDDQLVGVKTVDVESIALFPGYRIEANLAESIASRGWVKVVTPLQIEKIDPKASIISSSPNITQKEKLVEYQRIGQEAKVDAVFGVS